jgi:hypothetical protein
MATIEHSTLSGSELHDPKAHQSSHISGSDQLPVFTSTVKGLVPLSGGGTTNFLRADGTWAAGGGGATDHGALTGLGDDDHTQYLLVNGSRAMTGGLDMAGQWIIGLNNIRAESTNHYLNLVGGSNVLVQSQILIEGNTYGSTPGTIRFIASSGTGGTVDAVDIAGNTLTPKVTIYHGLDMNSNKITSVVDPTSAQDAATKNYVDTLAGIGTLGGLSDVTITSPASGDTIVHDGVDFKNVNIDTRIMATKLDDFTTPNDNTDLDSSTVQHGLLPKLGGGTVNFLRADGSWAPPPGAAGGETNTASNQGVAGVGVYYQKVGVDLQFKNINAANNQISITDDVGNHEIDIGVVESNIKLDDLGTAEDNTDLNATTGAHGLLLKLGGGSTNFLRADGTWAEPPGASGGEANTGTNVGTAGVGVFKQKTGVNLEFKKINAGSGSITITDDVANSEVGIDVGTNVFLVDGTRAMTNGLNMGGNDITNTTNIGPSGQTSLINLRGGSGQGAQIRVYGEDHTTHPGTMRLWVTNSAKNNLIEAVRVDGVTNTPVVDILHGIDMNSKKIESLLDPTSAQDAATKNYVDTHGGVTDHGALTGLGDDDHTQYLLVNGSRAMSGALVMNDYHITEVTGIQPSGTTVSISGILDVVGHKITSLLDPTSAQDAATKNYVDTHGGVTDHGALTGLADYDHDQYLRRNGGNTVTGNLLPDATASYRDLGSSAQKWDDVYAQDVRADRIHMAGNLDMNDYLIDDVDDIQAYDGTGVVMRNSGASSRIALAPTSYAFLAYANANMNTSYKIINLANPTLNQDAATKYYVDTHGGVTDHGALTGLADYDHDQYLRRNGGNTVTGTLLPSISAMWDLGSALSSFNNVTAVTGIMAGIQTDSIAKKTTKVDINDIGKLILNEPTELTISGGTVALTQSYHTIDTEGDASTDNLTHLTGGTWGQILIIRAANYNRTVVVKNDPTQSQYSIMCGTDFSLTSDADTMTLLSTGWSWVELSRSDNQA